MTTTLTASVNINVKGSLTPTPSVGNANYNFNESFNTSFANGTAAGQANAVWTDNRTITASSNDDLDFAGVLADEFGTTLTFTTIKSIVVKALAANTNDLIIGGDTTANITGIFGAAANTMNIKPGGIFVYEAPSAGIAVTPTTADKLRFTNGGAGTSVGYEIIVIGTK